MNEYDSEKILDVLRAHSGYEATNQIEQADLILFNTCSIREKAQEKVFSDLGRVKKFKERGVKIGVGGCVASQEGEAIIERAPYVDIVFGPQTLHRLPELITEREKQKKPQIDISFPEIEKFDKLIGLPNYKHSHDKSPVAFVSIMEGCSKYCSYCVVPYTRGEEISRPFEDVLFEVATLAEQGVKEVTLLGQNVNAYLGIMGEPNKGTNELADFAMLLETIAEIPGIERIRYTTSHPNEITPRLIEAYAKISKLVNHLHLPVQSGSDRILMAMKRGYTALQYKSIIRRLREARHNLSLSSDFIVGFPGETEQDFNKTINLIESIQFDNSFSFIFSPRPGTPAANLPDNTSNEDKLNRLQQLQNLINSLSISFSNKLLGTTQRILVEDHARQKISGISELMGRTQCNRVVNFAGNQSLIGCMLDVRITKVLSSHALLGELTEDKRKTDAIKK